MIIRPEILNTLKKYFKSSEKYFLVGGSVRDHLLNLTSNDLDIVCTCDTRIIARNIADEYTGAFFMLDEERNTCRVIVTESGEKRLLFDFAQVRNGDIESDLRERDFTVNAMAVDLSDLDVVIDPLNGIRDLHEQVLRPCSKSSFMDDPVRVIRAVRYSTGLSLNIENEVKQQILSAVKSLNNVSAERKRDELFKILQCSNAETSVRLLDELGILKSFDIEPQEINNTCLRLRIYEALTTVILNGIEPITPDENTLPPFLNCSETIRSAFAKHLELTYVDGRTIYGLDKLGVILWDMPEPIIKGFITNLNLSNQESDTLLRIIMKRIEFSYFLEEGSQTEDRKMYCYYKKLGLSGIDLALISLVGQISEKTTGDSKKVLPSVINVAEQLIRTWFERPNIVRPIPLLRGTDLFMEFDLAPGPVIGKLLEGLREEQAAGMVCTRQDALVWVEEQLFRKTIN